MMLHIINLLFFVTIINSGLLDVFHSLFSVIILHTLELILSDTYLIVDSLNVCRYFVNVLFQLGNSVSNLLQLHQVRLLVNAAPHESSESLIENSVHSIYLGIECVEIDLRGTSFKVVQSQIDLLQMDQDLEVVLLQGLQV